MALPAVCRVQSLPWIANHEKNFTFGGGCPTDKERAVCQRSRALPRLHPFLDKPIGE